MKGEVQLESRVERNPRDSDPLLDEHRHCVEPPQPPLPFSSSSPTSTSEIEDEDLEAGSLPCCRICLECDGEDGNSLSTRIGHFIGGSC